jgi:hypothetical protein
MMCWTDWTPLDSTGLGLDSQKWLVVQWTGLDWTGYCTSQSGLARGPLESTGVHMDYMGEGKDLRHRGACSHSCLSSGGEVLSDTRDHVCADKVVVLTGECTNTMQTCNLLSE